MQLPQRAAPHQRHAVLCITHSHPASLASHLRPCAHRRPLVVFLFLGRAVERLKNRPHESCRSVFYLSSYLIEQPNCFVTALGGLSPFSKASNASRR